MATWSPDGWKIEKALPEGGQAFTYVARRIAGSDEKQYVLKKLKNKERLSRFEREIEALKKLSHPGILRVVEAAESFGSPFYVAEYCEKGDLGRFDLSNKSLLEKLLLYREICDAMAAAHDAEIIHRDLKPQNILVRKDGSIAVGDFGLCLDLNDIEERLTESSEAVGARHYIAPELEDGKVVDPKPSSDVYSLGKLLYYILGGRSFAREQHRNTNYDLRAPDADVCLFFAYELLDKTIDSEPRSRYANARELLANLDTVIKRIEKDAHVLNINVPQHCLYCVIGRYQPMMGSAHEQRIVCMNCGNVQMFIGQRKWWTS
jgi:serine/threonine protein kinase